MKLALKNFSLALMIVMNSFVSLSAIEENRLTPEEFNMIREQRSAQNPFSVLNNPKVMAALRILGNNASELERIHKLAYYARSKILNNGQIVELFDNSKWYVGALEKYKVRNWEKTNTIFIKPTAACFSLYDYVLFNHTKGEAVDVNFGGIPKNYQAFTQRIIKIDYYQRLIQLDDAEGTVWEISFGDYAFDRWQYGDYIIVGVNNHWRSSTYPHILINASIIGSPYSEAQFFGHTFINNK